MNAVDLRALLADPAQAGAYFVDARDSEAIAQAGAALDFEVARIDLDGCSDKDEALRRIAGALQFPDWFGGNFDALADSLADLSWLPADGYLLLIEHAAGWRQVDIENFDILLDILNEAAAVWAEQGLALWGLLPLSAEQLAAVDA